MTQGGPQTPGGKSVSRWNSSKHGLRSSAPVIPGLEETEDWEAHLQGILQSLAPEGRLEQVLAERVALQSWRLDRVTRYEREVVARAQEEAEEIAVELGSGRSVQQSPVSENLKKKQQIRTFLNQIMQLPEEERVSRWLVEEVTWLGGLCVQAKPADRAELTVAPLESTEDRILDDAGESTVSSIKNVVAAYAERTGKSFEALLGEMKEHAQRSEDGAADAARSQGSAEGMLDRLQRERLLSDGKTLEKIARYEAHISRQMYQALHELEALQTRRVGGTAPLGRLDVQGDPQA